MAYARRIAPYRYGLPNLQLASERQGMGMPMGMTATTPNQDRQQNQTPQMPMGLLSGLGAKEAPGYVNALPSSESIMGNYFNTIGPSDPISAQLAGVDSMAPNLGLGVAPETGLSAGFEGGALSYLPQEAAIDTALTSTFAPASGVTPAIEAASALPAVDAGLAAGGAAEGAAAATAAGEAGLLGSLGSMSVLGPLAGIGILGYLGMKNGWFD